jgi:hypothetical protein
MLTEGEEYSDQGQDYYEARYRQSVLRQLVLRQLVLRQLVHCATTEIGAKDVFVILSDLPSTEYLSVFFTVKLALPRTNL